MAMATKPVESNADVAEVLKKVEKTKNNIDPSASNRGQSAEALADLSFDLNNLKEKYKSNKDLCAAIDYWNSLLSRASSILGDESKPPKPFGVGKTLAEVALGSIQTGLGDFNKTGKIKVQLPKEAERPEIKAELTQAAITDRQQKAQMYADQMISSYVDLLNNPTMTITTPEEETRKKMARASADNIEMPTTTGQSISSYNEAYRLDALDDLRGVKASFDLETAHDEDLQKRVNKIIMEKMGVSADELMDRAAIVPLVYQTIQKALRANTLEEFEAITSISTGSLDINKLMLSMPLDRLTKLVEETSAEFQRMNANYYLFSCSSVGDIAQFKKDLAAFNSANNSTLSFSDTELQKLKGGDTQTTLTSEDGKTYVVRNEEGGLNIYSSTGGILTNDRFKNVCAELSKRVYGNENLLVETAAMLSDQSFLDARKKYDQNAEYNKSILFYDIRTQYAFFTATKEALEARGLWNPTTVNMILDKIKQTPDLIDIRQKVGMDDAGRAFFFASALPSIVMYYPTAIDQLVDTCVITDMRISNRYSGNEAVKNEMLRLYYQGVPKSLEGVVAQRGEAQIDESKAPGEWDYTIVDAIAKARQKVKAYQAVIPTDTKNPYGYLNLPLGVAEALPLINLQWMINNAYGPPEQSTGYIYSLSAAIRALSYTREIENRFYDTRFNGLAAGYMQQTTTTEQGASEVSHGTKSTYLQLAGAASRFMGSGSVTTATGRDDTYTVRSSGTNMTLPEFFGLTGGVNSFATQMVTDTSLIASLDLLLAKSSSIKRQEGQNYGTAPSAVNAIAYYFYNEKNKNYDANVFVKYGDKWAKVIVHGIDIHTMKALVFYNPYFDASASVEGKDLKDLNGLWAITTLGPVAAGTIIDGAQSHNYKNMNKMFFATTEVGKTEWTAKYYETAELQKKKSTAESTVFSPADQYEVLLQTIARNQGTEDKYKADELNQLWDLLNEWKRNGVITTSQLSAMTSFVINTLNSRNGSVFDNGDVIGGAKNDSYVTLIEMVNEFRATVSHRPPFEEGGTVVDQGYAIKTVASIALSARSKHNAATVGLGITEPKNYYSASALHIGKTVYEDAAWFHRAQQGLSLGGNRKINETGGSLYANSNAGYYIIGAGIADETKTKIDGTTVVLPNGNRVQLSGDITMYAADSEGKKKKSETVTGVYGFSKGRAEVAAANYERTKASMIAADVQVVIHTTETGKTTTAGLFAKQQKAPYGKQGTIGAGIAVPIGKLGVALGGSTFMDAASGWEGYLATGVETPDLNKFVFAITGAKKTELQGLAELGAHVPLSQSAQAKLEQAKWAVGLYGKMHDGSKGFLVIEKQTLKAEVVEFKDLKLNAGFEIYKIDKGGFFKFGLDLSEELQKQFNAGILSRDYRITSLALTVNKNDVLEGRLSLQNTRDGSTKWTTIRFDMIWSPIGAF